MISHFTRTLVIASISLTVGAALAGNAHAADARVAGMDRTGLSVSPARTVDVYTDGARNGPRDPYTDGARIGERDPYTDGA